MSTALITLGVVAYLTAGLFVSRIAWRRAAHRDDIAAELNALGAFLFWPTAIVGAGVVKFIRWFYVGRDDR